MAAGVAPGFNLTKDAAENAPQALGSKPSISSTFNSAKASNMKFVLAGKSFSTAAIEISRFTPLITATKRLPKTLCADSLPNHLRTKASVTTHWLACKALVTEPALTGKLTTSKKPLSTYEIFCISTRSPERSATPSPSTRV
jgi:hypothetical protein